MKTPRPLSDAEKARVLAELRRDVARRQQSYREQALRLFAHLCARCGRAFEGRRLRELTVHHRDHNHDNNPPDGSNWELLCLYCHDHEHEKRALAGHYDDPGSATEKFSPPIFKPFESLDRLLPPAAPRPASGDATPDAGPPDSTPGPSA